MNPFELADYAGFLLALLTGTGIGRAMRPKKPKPPKPICSCKHGHGAHEEGGRCLGDGKRAIRWDEYGDANKWEPIPCPCLRYDGPDPLIVEMMR